MEGEISSVIDEKLREKIWWIAYSFNIYMYILALMRWYRTIYSIYAGKYSTFNEIQSKPLSLSLMISPISCGNRRAKLTLMKSASLSRIALLLFLSSSLHSPAEKRSRWKEKKKSRIIDETIFNFTKVVRGFDTKKKKGKAWKSLVHGKRPRHFCHFSATVFRRGRGTKDGGRPTKVVSLTKRWTTLS